MAGFRTVHRGSRGRFAGSSSGRAEKVRVSRRTRIGNSIKKNGKKAARVGLVAGVSVGAGALGHAAIGRAVHGKKKSGLYSGKGVGRKEVVSMPKSPLNPFATGGDGRSARNGHFAMPGPDFNPTAGGVSNKPGGRVYNGTKVTPNYSAAKGRKEYVGRRIKPGEGYGFKLKVN